MEDSYYSIFSLPFGAPTDEVKRRYRELAKTYHPDKSGNGSHDLMAKLNAAYSTLSDPAKKVEYDSCHGHQLVNAGSTFSSTAPRAYRPYFRESAYTSHTYRSASAGPSRQSYSSERTFGTSLSNHLPADLAARYRSFTSKLHTRYSSSASAARDLCQEEDTARNAVIVAELRGRLALAGPYNAGSLVALEAHHRQHVGAREALGREEVVLVFQHRAFCLVALETLAAERAGTWAALLGQGEAKKVKELAAQERSAREQIVHNSYTRGMVIHLQIEEASVRMASYRQFQRECAHFRSRLTGLHTFVQLFAAEKRQRTGLADSFFASIGLLTLKFVTYPKSRAMLEGDEEDSRALLTIRSCECAKRHSLVLSEAVGRGLIKERETMTRINQRTLSHDRLNKSRTPEAAFHLRRTPEFKREVPELLPSFTDSIISMCPSADVEPKSRVSLLCPITAKVIVVPVRGRACKHLQCFDLQSYLEEQIASEKSSKPWCCPFCCLPIPSNDLVIDTFVVYLLKKRTTHETYVDAVLPKDRLLYPLVTAFKNVNSIKTMINEMKQSRNVESILSLAKEEIAKPATTHVSERTERCEASRASHNDVLRECFQSGDIDGYHLFSDRFCRHHPKCDPLLLLQL